MSNYPGRDQYMECARILANMAETMSTYMKCASAAILDMDRMIHECDIDWRQRYEELHEAHKKTLAELEASK